MLRAGKYELLEELPKGGVGRVFLGQLEGSDDVPLRLIKVVNERARRNSFFTATLHTEAPAATAFKHPGALSTFAVEDDDEHLIIVQEMANGPTWAALRERARSAGRTFSADSLLLLGVQTARVLAAAQETPWAHGETDGLVIGQLSPHGMYVTPTGELRIAGVGLGRSRVCLPPSRDRLPYRAPELFEREPVSSASDVYGLGVVLYDAFANADTFERDSVAQVKDAVIEVIPPPLSHLPSEVDRLLHQMMAKDPTERPFDMSVVIRAFESVMGREPALVAAEWAEHLRVLFPERFDSHDSIDVARRVQPRVSGPYIQTRKSSTPRPVGPPSSVTAAAPVGPNGYDLDDLALALDSGDIEPQPRASTPPRSWQAPATESSGPHEALLGITDAAQEFDVDSVVNAIFSSRPASADEASATQAWQENTPFVEPKGLESPRRVRSAESRPARAPSPPNPRPVMAEPETADATPALGSPSPWEAPADPAPPQEDSDEGTAEELAPGDAIQGRYCIIEELGRGGMSIVYRAEHMLLMKDVAVKLLRPELSMLQNVVERFQREARAVCRLDNPHIVRVTDFGRTDGGLLYLVMDLMNGVSLAELVQDGQPIGVDRALGLVRQILDGLTHAHRSEIVHRDLKPENIMLVDGEAGEQVRILDFGIAKLGGHDNQSITQAGTVFGTPRYMSPEQAAGEPVDHRTDLYTVGVILYQLLTGKVPFAGDSTVQLLAKVLTQPPPPMEFPAASGSIKERLERVTMKALSKEPEDRFESAESFRQALSL